MKKKTLWSCIGLLVVLLLGLIGWYHWDSVTAESTTTTPPNAVVSSDAAKLTTSKPHKVLVVYYSAQGHTAEIAKAIVQATGADSLELQPKNAYTTADLNYRDSTSRVVREHDNPALQKIPLVKAVPDNWQSYDVVFIGYPIWWGLAAWPVNEFITSNSFEGKTVIPFATSISSGFGQSGAVLAKLAGSGQWQAGMRFASNASVAEVRQWVKGLGL